MGADQPSVGSHATVMWDPYNKSKVRSMQYAHEQPTQVPP